MNWIELPSGKYKVRSGAHKISNCQIECEISCRDIISHLPEGEWAKFAPLRVLSFDIECAGRPGIFPEASIDPVIQIANVVTTYGPTIAEVFLADLREHKTFYSKRFYNRYMFTNRWCTSP
jgi:DNA polymerase delta subunit 1